MALLCSRVHCVTVSRWFRPIYVGRIAGRYMTPFANEGQYRDWVRNELESRLTSTGPDYLVFRSKNVNDIIICKSADGRETALFVEVKYHRANFGRIGLGDGRGQGFQPEILARRPAYFERYVRWLIGSEADVAVLVSSETLRRFAVGGDYREGKQNNIQPAIFSVENRPFPLDDSAKVVAEWVVSA